MVERYTKKVLERKEKLAAFFKKHNILWKKKYFFESIYKMKYIDIYIKTKRKWKNFFKSKIKIGELYIDQKIKTAHIIVLNGKYEPYLYNILEKMEKELNIERAEIVFGSRVK